MVYGLVGLKTHSKILMVVRREPEASSAISARAAATHNAVSARIYTDIGYFTTDADIGADVSDLFNALTGYSAKQDYRKLLVAPGSMRREIIRRIQREIERQRDHGDGYLAFKMNQLVDKDCIRALYEASQAGVKIDLQVRHLLSAAWHCLASADDHRHQHRRSFSRTRPHLFNFITGYSRDVSYLRLLVAPDHMRTDLVSLIRGERPGPVGHTPRGEGRIVMKMNSLVDPEVIDELYAASRDGVEVDLIVRGICCLRPGVPGLSDRIRVRSIVGRYLEHSRIYRFANGSGPGVPSIHLGSADLMPRNLDRRVEQLFPVDDPQLKESLRQILDIQLRDNVKSRRMHADGSYERIRPQPGDDIVDSQQWLVEHRGFWNRGD
ncbi:MAG: hypothetical protein KIS63_00880 [Caldilineales bacterium]|nr:hypothetical protein [Caldilineales bacterium]